MFDVLRMVFIQIGTGSLIVIVLGLKGLPALIAHIFIHEQHNQCQAQKKHTSACVIFIVSLPLKATRFSVWGPAESSFIALI